MNIRKIMEQYESTGMRIRKLRECKGKTLIAVQCDTGINISRLSRIERGILRNVHIQEMMLIAQSLGVTPNHLMGYVNDPADTAIYEDETCSAREMAHRMRVIEFDKEEYRKMGCNN